MKGFLQRAVENRKGHSEKNLQILTGKDCQIPARTDVKRHWIGIGSNHRIYIRFRCCLCWLQGGCTGWIINQGFLIAHRVWVSDILFLVFHEKVI